MTGPAAAAPSDGRTHTVFGMVVCEMFSGLSLERRLLARYVFSHPVGAGPNADPMRGIFAGRITSKTDYKGGRGTGTYLHSWYPVRTTYRMVRMRCRSRSDESLGELTAFPGIRPPAGVRPAPALARGTRTGHAADV